MKNTQKFKFSLLYFGLFSNFLFAQDLQFSQFFQLPSVVNPAYVSVPSGAQIKLAHRKQWGQVQSGFNGLLADASIRLANAGRQYPNKSIQTGLGMGIQVLQSKEPTFGYKEQEAAAQIGAFVGDAERITLHAGLCGTLGRRSVNFDQLVFSGQLDPVFGISNPSNFNAPANHLVETFTVGAGLAVRGQLSGKKVDVPYGLGLAIRQLAGSRDVSFLGNPSALLARVICIHGSISVPMNREFRSISAWYLSPMFRYDWAGYDSWKMPLGRGMAGLMMQRDFVRFGGLLAFNRRPDSGQNTSSLLMVLGGDIPVGGNKIQITYNYEAPLKGLGLGASGGAHELSAVFDFPGTVLFSGKSKKRQTRCYQFAGKGFSGMLN